MTVKRIFLMGMLLLLAFGLAFAGGGTDRGNDSGIYGTWECCCGSLWVFHRGGRVEYFCCCDYPDYPSEGTFTARNGQITIDGALGGTYTISGNTLRINADGSILTLQRRR